MSASRKVVPSGLPESPPFADVGYVHRRGDILTLVFMRRQFGPEGDEGDGETAIAAPTVASVTMTVEIARGIAELIAGVAEDPRKV